MYAAMVVLFKFNDKNEVNNFYEFLSMFSHRLNATSTVSIKIHHFIAL